MMRSLCLLFVVLYLHVYILRVYEHTFVYCDLAMNISQFRGIPYKISCKNKMCIKMTNCREVNDTKMTLMCYTDDEMKVCMVCVSIQNFLLPYKKINKGCLCDE